MKKLTIEFVRESFEKEGFTLLSNDYINSYTKLNYICSKGHKHNIVWQNWQQGQRCPYCAKKAKPFIEFVKEAFEKEGYILLDTVYVNANTKLNYICPNGHEHSIIWNNWNHNHRCPTCYLNNITGQGNHRWKGGIVKRDVSLYNTYNDRISYCEETRRDPNETILLQVRCTKCNKWFTPNLNQINSRINALNSFNNAEHRFYCSDECRHSCSVFGKKKYSYNDKRYKTNPNFTSADLKIWSDEVLKRAGYICEYCSAPAEHAHHIQPKKVEPFYALDPENGVACCKSCHYKYGHNKECSTSNLASILCK